MASLMEDAPAATRRVVTYERVSSDTQREHETIKTQAEALERRLAAETGVVVVARYIDDGVSGRKPLAKRPGGIDLLRDAEAHRFDELWVYKPDRLGRNLADMAVTVDRLHELGITIWSVSQGKLDKFLFKLMSLLAEDEADRLRDRFADGIERAAREGRYVGGIRPYGYRVEGEKGDGRFVPDEDEVSPGWTAAGVVRFMFTKVGIDDWSPRRVADDLNALGVPTRYALDGRGIRGKRTRQVWTRGRIGNMLKEPIYRGEQVFGRRARRPRETISLAVPALVSPELWQAAQDTLARHLIAPHNSRRVYLLRSIMRCSICGLTYVGSSSKGTTWYRCGGQLVERGPLEGRCPSRSIRGDILEPVVWQDIERFLRTPGDLLSELDGHAEHETEVARIEGEADALRRRLESIAGERREMLRQRFRGRLSDDDLDAELSRIDVDRDAVERLLEALVPPPAEEHGPDLDLLDQLRSNLDQGLTAEQRQEIVTLLIRRITITTLINDDGTKDAKAKIEYDFPAVVETRTGRGSWPR